ncbi:MAG TPA: hypothetical protein P5540_03855, partial [Candidatus Hydrogenedentes bacterium]|nr:hypothetical protein [Candidatus Hydrogenedentota bacterium]
MNIDLTPRRKDAKAIFVLFFFAPPRLRVNIDLTQRRKDAKAFLFVLLCASAPSREPSISH